MTRRLTIREDQSLPPGWAAITISTPPAGLAPLLSITRRGYADTPHLGPAGWQSAECLIEASRVRAVDGAQEWLFGPQVTQHLSLEMDVLIKVPGAGIEERHFWPEVSHGAAVAIAPGPAARGGVGVVGALFFGDGIVGDHRVDVARRDQKGVFGPPEAAERVGIGAIRLREHPDAVTQPLEKPRNDGDAEARVIDIGVAGDADKIHRVPAAQGGLPHADRQKFRIGRHGVFHPCHCPDFCMRLSFISIQRSLEMSTCRGLEPSNGPTMPRASSSSMSRAARA